MTLKAELDMPKTPMCEKLAQEGDVWNHIFAFIEWLHENNMTIAAWRTPEELAEAEGKSVEYIKKWRTYLLEQPYPIDGTANLLYKYLRIDLGKLEEERRELLEYMRRLNTKP